MSLVRMTLHARHGLGCWRPGLTCLTGVRVGRSAEVRPGVRQSACLGFDRRQVMGPLEVDRLDLSAATVELDSDGDLHLAVEFASGVLRVEVVAVILELAHFGWDHLVFDWVRFLL